MGAPWTPPVQQGFDNDNSMRLSFDSLSKFIKTKYAGKTCKILTMNTLTGKLCIKECGKIVGEMSEDEVNAVSDIIPKQFGKVFALKDAYEESEQFKAFCDKNLKIFKIYMNGSSVKWQRVCAISRHLLLLNFVYS